MSWFSIKSVQLMILKWCLADLVLWGFRMLQSDHKLHRFYGESAHQLLRSFAAMHFGVELRPWTFQWDLTLKLLIWTVSHINRSLHQWVIENWLMLLTNSTLTCLSTQRSSQDRKFTLSQFWNIFRYLIIFLSWSNNPVTHTLWQTVYNFCGEHKRH